MDAAFLWERPAGCPEELPLYFLAKQNCQRVAAAVSCHQEIAGAGAFSLGLSVEFEATLCAEGAWTYPRLFWEAGMIGQVLYLEAEAAGVRATGIGCYFDDAMHQCFGLAGDAYQSMYHFTVGGAVEADRPSELPTRPQQRVRRGASIDLWEAPSRRTTAA